MIKIKKEILLLRPKDFKPSDRRFGVLGVFNPGATRLPNGNILLYVRVWEKLKIDQDEKFYYSPRCVGKKEYKIILDEFDKKKTEFKTKLDFSFKDGTKRLTAISHLRRVILDKTGFNVKKIENKPSFFGLINDGELGIEDPRITKIDNKYYMTYVSLSRIGNVSTSYAVSKDCLNWKRKGIIFREQNKDAVFFSEKINGKYYAFNRPEGGFEFTPPHIWISESKDLDYWGKPKPIMLSKKRSWDSGRVGAGPPPIKTDKGWLLIYHGVTERKKYDNFLARLFGFMKEYSVYSIGAALFDLRNPRKLIAKTKNPIIVPHKIYETMKIENKKVVFPTGIVVDLNGKDLLIYSGGADKFISVKKIALKDIMDSLEKVKLQ